MFLEDLPRTISWEPAGDNWVHSVLSVTGADAAAPHLTLVDQRKLPQQLEYVDCFTAKQVCDAIEDLTVRGAPALGISGAFAIVLWAYNEWPLIAKKLTDEDKRNERTADVFMRGLQETAAQVIATRPTAVNLSWGVRQMVTFAQVGIQERSSIKEIIAVLEHRATEIMEEDEELCRQIGLNGTEILRELSVKLGRPLRIETHCNAGSLATAFYGTATSVIYHAHAEGLVEKVWVDETRPVEQGARLTAWELGKAGVPYTLICDNMAGSLMQAGLVDVVITGADRICVNGDAANKIGTYPLAVMANFHEVPFYIAAPYTTFDEELATGEQITIEQRDPQEVRCMPNGREWLPVAPADCDVYNPAFDVTPYSLITGIITENGIWSPEE